MADAALQVDCLSHAFHPGTSNEVRALDAVDLALERGTFTVVLGTNGSGKSSLLNAIAGTLPAGGGRIRLDGRDITRWPEEQRARLISRVFQNPFAGTASDLTVAENLRFYSGLYGIAGPEGRQRRAEVLEQYGLAGRAEQLAGTLSGGWKQRLALACATAHRPDLVFLDEPTAGVDPAARRHFWEIIGQHAAAGLTVVVTTHYMDEAERCDRLGLMSRGRLIGLGTPAEIREHFGQPSIEDVFVELQRQDEGAAA